MSTIDTLRPILRAEMSKLRIPLPSDKVFKDECMYSFDSPFSDLGLYVNMNTFHGVGKSYLNLDIQKTGCKLYLHEKWTQIAKEKERSDTANDNATPTKLAIGVEGGFNSGETQYETIKEHALVVIEGELLHTFQLPNSDIPEFITNVADGIIKHDGMKSNLEVKTWDADNEKFVSKYAAALEQVNPSGKKISQDPKTWVDEETGAVDNLWLNLSTGYIGGGRKNWDGSGGSGSALKHFEDTGNKYPLVVKLGTITPHGADVYSYAPDENDMVLDPLLAEHLSFWGIDIMRLEKTAKTMGELEVAMNLNYDWTRLMDGQIELETLHGPGFVGLRNIGSSCYLNSAMQCILALPEVQERYLLTHDAIVSSSSADTSSDFLVQLSKLAVGALTDRYVPREEDRAAQPSQTSGSLEEAVNSVSLEKYVVAPRTFKHLVGKGHSEFSSGRQQDVSEFFQHFLEVMSRAERANLGRIVRSADAKPTSSIFEFHLETRFQCVETGEVRYSKTGQQTLENTVELPIPLERGVSSEDPDAKRQRLEETNAGHGSAEQPDANLLVPFNSCLESFAAPQVVEMFSPTLGRNAQFTRTTRFRTFPRYLMVKMARYYAGPNWVQVKVNAKVDVPEQLDLTALRGTGLQPGEKELPEETAAPNGGSSSVSAAPMVADEAIVMQLVSMGFSENGSRRAVLATHNSDAENAMNWVMEHMEDANFNDPPAAAVPAASDSGERLIEPEVLEMLTSMGYSERQVTGALKATNYDVERAADWLFSHSDNLDQAVADALGESATEGGSDRGDQQDAGEDGEGKFTLVAVISHIGRNTEHGHYVCHIKKGDTWALFNDEKVGKCNRPPLEHGFMYLYRRNDGRGSFFV